MNAVCNLVILIYLQTSSDYEFKQDATAGMGNRRSFQTFDGLDRKQWKEMEEMKKLTRQLPLSWRQPEKNSSDSFIPEYLFCIGKTPGLSCQNAGGLKMTLADVAILNHASRIDIQT